MAVVAAVFAAAVLLAAEEPRSEGEGLLGRALAYHDPGSVWPTGHFRLTLASERPDGSTRTTLLEIDNARGLFIAQRETGGGLLRAEIGPGERCVLSLDGSLEVPTETAESLGIDCDRWRRLRNYYHYMWGLPMKLRDPGTQLDEEVGEEDFNGAPSRVLGVTYEPETGGDTWYFYFELATSRALGYRFYHDPAINDGEYIVLEGEVEAGGVRFPRRQTWYMNHDDELLGSDELVSAEVLD